MNWRDKARCWVCWGKGKVKGPLYWVDCPNPNCPYVKRECGRKLSAGATQEASE